MMQMGGAVKGGQILGQYPDRLDSNGDLNAGRGRMIPTRPWEAIWEPTATWMGVETAKVLLCFVAFAVTLLL